MGSTRTFVRGSLSALAAAVLLTNGCSLPHAPLYGPIGKVQPANYCPGDMVTASYDLISPDSCVSHSGLDCATIQPNITLSSSPMVFPTRTITSFAGSQTFTPTEDAIDVSFSTGAASSRQIFLLPTVDASGNRIVKQLPVMNNVARVTRINGSGTYDLSFAGVCMGQMPAHAPSSLPGAPAFSSNLRLSRICNTTAPGSVSLSIGGQLFMLAPGACQDIDAATLIPGGAVATLLSAPIDPGTRCSSIEGGMPPAEVRLQATMTCR